MLASVLGTKEQKVKRPLERAPARARCHFFLLLIFKFKQKRLTMINSVRRSNADVQFGAISSHYCTPALASQTIIQFGHDVGGAYRDTDDATAKIYYKPVTPMIDRTDTFYLLLITIFFK